MVFIINNAEDLKVQMTTILAELTEANKIILEPPTNNQPTGNDLHVMINRFPRDVSADRICYQVSIIQFNRDDYETFERAIALVKYYFPVHREFIPDYRKGIPLQAFYEIERSKPDFAYLHPDSL